MCFFLPSPTALLWACSSLRAVLELKLEAFAFVQLIPFTNSRFPTWPWPPFKVGMNCHGAQTDENTNICYFSQSISCCCSRTPRLCLPPSTPGCNLSMPTLMSFVHIYQPSQRSKGGIKLIDACCHTTSVVVEACYRWRVAVKYLRIVFVLNESCYAAGRVVGFGLVDGWLGSALRFSRTGVITACIMEGRELSRVCLFRIRGFSFGEWRFIGFYAASY